MSWFSSLWFLWKKIGSVSHGGHREGEARIGWRKKKTGCSKGCHIYFCARTRSFLALQKWLIESLILFFSYFFCFCFLGLIYELKPSKGPITRKIRFEMSMICSGWCWVMFGLCHRFSVFDSKDLERERTILQEKTKESLGLKKCLARVGYSWWRWVKTPNPNDPRKVLKRWLIGQKVPEVRSRFWTTSPVFCGFLSFQTSISMIEPMFFGVFEGIPWRSRTLTHC